MVAYNLETDDVVMEMLISEESQEINMTVTITLHQPFNAVIMFERSNMES